MALTRADERRQRRVNQEQVALQGQIAALSERLANLRKEATVTKDTQRAKVRASEADRAALTRARHIAPGAKGHRG